MSPKMETFFGLTIVSLLAVMVFCIQEIAATYFRPSALISTIRSYTVEAFTESPAQIKTRSCMQDLTVQLCDICHKWCGRRPKLCMYVYGTRRDVGRRDEKYEGHSFSKWRQFSRQPKMEEVFQCVVHTAWCFKKRTYIFGV